MALDERQFLWLYTQKTDVMIGSLAQSSLYVLLPFCRSAITLLIIESKFTFRYICFDILVHASDAMFDFGLGVPSYHAPVQEQVVPPPEIEALSTPIPTNRERQASSSLSSGPMPEESEPEDADAVSAIVRFLN